MKKANQYIKPMSLPEYLEKFGTEEKCREHLFNERFSNGFVCPQCGHNKGYKIATRSLMKCTECEYQLSATAGTIFHNTKTPLLKWYLAIYLITIDKRGISALQLQKEIGVTYKTAWYMNKRIREAMKIADDKYLLEDNVVIDEAYFSGVKQPPNGNNKPKKRGRGTRKNKVIVALSSDDSDRPRHLKMKVVKNFRAATIANFAKENIEKGAKIMTDGFASYKSQKITKDYFHEFENFDKHDDNSALKWIHKVISNAKAFIDGTPHGLKPGSLQNFLDEFCYRFNRRKIPMLIPEKLVASLLCGKPMLYYGVVKG
jgi:transposase-like protein